MVALTFEGVFSEKEFDERGFGRRGVMLLKSRCGQHFADLAELLQLIVSGKATATIQRLSRTMASMCLTAMETNARRFDQTGVR